MNASITPSPDSIAGQFAALGELQRPEWYWLRDSGVPPAMLRRQFIRRARVTFEKGIFEFAEDDSDGLLALLFLVTNRWREPIDIAAWQPRSGRLGSWYGRAWGLGEGSIFDSRLTFDGNLPVWRGPLNWLRADRVGLVLLRPDAAGTYLADVGPLLAEDVAHGLELRKALALPAPRIVVPTNGGRAAA